MTTTDARGNAEADFAQFYDATWRRTVACAYAVAGELGLAEEAAQEAYVRAWPRWSKLREYDDPGAWVRQVATRQAISGWRRRRTARLHLVRSRPPEPVAGPEPESVALTAAIARLPEAQRWALVLHHLAGVSIADIASHVLSASRNVMARHSRAQVALAGLLDDTANGAH